MTLYYLNKKNLVQLVTTRDRDQINKTENRKKLWSISSFVNTASLRSKHLKAKYKESFLKIIFGSDFIITSYHESIADEASRFHYHQAMNLMKEPESLHLVRIQRRMIVMFSYAGDLRPSKSYNLSNRHRKKQMKLTVNICKSKNLRSRSFLVCNAKNVEEIISDHNLLQTAC